MPITFRVDDVDAAAEPPATRTLREQLGADAVAIGGDPESRVLAELGSHALLAAVHRAFAEHRPLVISPDAIWLTIAEGVAHHVRLHASTLRGRLVRHDGRKRLDVVSSRRFSDEPAALESMVEAFRARLAQEIGDGPARIFACDFSTSTDVDRTASDIVLLDAYSPYFDFLLVCVCGIPEMTITGTPTDWRAIRSRLDVISELDLTFWTTSLVPIVDRFVEAAEGRPDIEWFRAICKPRRAYGPEKITGWIGRLYPYLGSAGRFDQRNPLLDVPIDARLPEVATGEWYEGPGITTDSVPSGGSCARIRVLDGDGAFDVAMHGGLLAVSVDAGGRLVPAAGWYLRRDDAGIGEIAERILAEQVAAPPEARAPRVQGTTAELHALYDTIGSATLFGGMIRIRPRSGSPMVMVDRICLVRHVDLADGSFLAVALVAGASWARIRDDQLVLRSWWAPGASGEPRWVCVASADEIPVVSSSLASVLRRALDGGGIPDLPPTQVLSEAVPEALAHGVAPLPPSAPRAARRGDAPSPRQGVPIAPHTTFELGGKSQFLIEALEEAHIVEALAWAHERGLPVKVLGGGSNLVVSDGILQGLVLAIRTRGIGIHRLGDRAYVHAAAGESWDDLVARAVDEDLAGLECLSGIPGLVGATPIQNVGAYGQEVGDTIYVVRALDRRTLDVVELGPAECELAYRDSMFKRNPDRYVVLSVVFALVPGGSPTVKYAELEKALAGKPRDLRTVRETVIALRRAKSMVIDPDDPNRRSAGSFFTNPIVDAAVADALSAVHPAMPRWAQADGRVKLAAGWLIEQSGIHKGMRRGNVGISSKHALALVHHGGGTTRELLALADEVRGAVRTKFGVGLEREPVLWGDEVSSRA